MVAACAAACSMSDHVLGRMAMMTVMALRSENMHVVLQLCDSEPLYGHNYNVMTDNFFASKHLAEVSARNRLLWWVHCVEIVESCRNSLRMKSEYGSLFSRAMVTSRDTLYCTVKLGQEVKAKVVNVLSSIHPLEMLFMMGAKSLRLSTSTTLPRLVCMYRLN